MIIISPLFFFLINSKMSWWSSNQSNMINGTDGAVFHPLINRNELLYIFAADLCRYACAAFVPMNLFTVKASWQGEAQNSQ